MDYVTVVIAAGKLNFVSADSRSRKQIVRREILVTTTGSQTSDGRQNHPQLFFTLACLPSK